MWLSPKHVFSRDQGKGDAIRYYYENKIKSSGVNSFETMLAFVKFTVELVAL